ncbi:MAG: BrnT family toxin [Acidobacteria bacterium]|nr:BrnT family toxin [Acidobacteriota bacterium]MBI3657062.1 BrnT family toxin [Acidobacteriota bacterium]
MRFKFDNAKSQRLRKKRGIGFEEAQELFYSPYYLDQILDDPVQWVAIGWVKAGLYSVIYEEREDAESAYYHLVTLWKSTKAERLKYEENS